MSRYFSTQSRFSIHSRSTFLIHYSSSDLHFFIFIFFLQIFILDIRHLFPIDIHCFNFPSFPQIYNLVKNYISTKETIIMVVVACNMEIATTKALKMANEVDPDGIRTLGIVLSNPFVPCNNRISLKLNNSR